MLGRILERLYTKTEQWGELTEILQISPDEAIRIAKGILEQIPSERMAQKYMKSPFRNPRSSLMMATAGGAEAAHPGATNIGIPGRPARRIASLIQPTSWMAPWTSFGE